MLKQLKDVKYPDDFKCPRVSVVSDVGINELLNTLPISADEFVGTGNTLVVLTSTGYLEVYIKIAECEVEVPW